MAYSKTNWTENTGITPGRLNNLESQYEKAVALAEILAGEAKPVVGSYTGGQSTVNLGFRPKAVLIGLVDITTHPEEIAVLAFDGDVEYNIVFKWEEITLIARVYFSATGFSIHPDISLSGNTYKYIAFR